MGSFLHHLKLFVVFLSGDLWTLAAVVGNLVVVLVVRGVLFSRGVIAVAKVVTVRRSLPADGDRRRDVVATMI